MKPVVISALTVVCIGMFAFTAAADDAALKAAIAGPQRTATNAARDGARHPYESLTFWGLKPHETVLEVIPGGGYWTEILTPYAKATGGSYEATVFDISTPNTPEEARKEVAAFEARFGDKEKFGNVTFVPWSRKSTSLGRPGSVDLVLIARNVHNLMWQPGRLDSSLKQFYDVLKPGGILAVEEHRADPRPQVKDALDGYVSTAFVIDAAKKAGFELDGKSEINANPKDTKDYPYGVWTLPPTNATSLQQEELKTWPGRPDDSTYKGADFYKAIGESDRMTLRFKKPG